jgi:hypothetical protein
MTAFAHPNGRQLKEIPTEDQLDTTKRTRVPPQTSADEGDHIEQLRREHGDLVDDEDLGACPPLSDFLAAGSEADNLLERVSTFMNNESGIFI